MALPAHSTTLEPKTYDDLLATPADGNRYELIFGEIVVSPAPKTIHQRISMTLSKILGMYVGTHELGELFSSPIDVRLSPYNVVEPDLVFVSRSRFHIVLDDFIDGAPDLVIEILSPSNRSRDLVAKASLYADHGIPEYWTVDPDTESITVLRLHNQLYSAVDTRDGIVRSTAISGLELPVADVFAKPAWWPKAE
jgi:Uma2 family endonuclease